MTGGMLGGDDRRPFDGVTRNQVQDTPTLARGRSFSPPVNYMAGFRRPDFVPGPRLGTTELGLRFNRDGLLSPPRSPQLALNGSLNEDGGFGDSERPQSPESPYLFPIRPKQGQFAGRESRFAWKPTWMTISNPQERAPCRFEHLTSAACDSPSLEPLGREMEQTLETHHFRKKRGSDNVSGVRSMRGARRNGNWLTSPQAWQYANIY